jgi:hypothetical protein
VLRPVGGVRPRGANQPLTTHQVWAGPSAMLFAPASACVAADSPCRGLGRIVFRRGSVRSEGSGPASRRVGRRGAADPGDGDHPRHRADRGASAPGRQVKDAGAKLVWSPQATCACTATPPMPPAP